MSVIISHSEVETRLSCERRHWYAFGDSTFGEHAGLEPKMLSDSLYRGITGHTALGVFYGAIKAKLPYDEAVKAAIGHLDDMAMSAVMNSGNPRDITIISDLKSRILPRYFNGKGRELHDKGWRPEYVEHVFRLEMDFDGGRYVYPFKPDVIMLDPSGNRWVFDHKFVYNFYDETAINLLPQIPKYIGALRALGIHIKGGYYNQLRWREVKDPNAHVSQDRFVPTDARVQNAFRQQFKVMEEIASLKTGPLSDWDADTTRVLNNMVCKGCSFKSLCTVELNGHDSTLMRKVEFKANTYGYQESD